MAVRLYSEFNSSNDILYRVEIHDSLFTGTASEFTVASDGFTLNYSGETDDIVSPIISSKCEISAYNNSDAFDDFLAVLNLHQEDRFFVRIYRKDKIKDAISNYERLCLIEGASIEDVDCVESTFLDLDSIDVNATVSENFGELFWTGVVMQDLVSVEDLHKPTLFKLTAVDGIGRLKEEDYPLITGESTILSFIQSAVNAIGTSDLFASDDIFLSTVVNIWDENQTYSLTSDVTSLTRFARILYRNVNEQGDVVYSKYLDILRELCIAFGARFYQRDGGFVFEQYLERAETIRRIHSYYKSGTKAFSIDISDDVSLNQTTEIGARLAGNEFNYLPAIKRVQVTFDQERVNNLLATELTFTDTTPRQDLGFVSSADNGRLQVNGELSYQLGGIPAGTISAFYRPVWRIELRVEDTSNPGTFYYLKREWLGGTGAQLYGPTTWTTTASYYDIDGGIALTGSGGLYLYAPIAVVTPALPVSGIAEIDVEFLNVYDRNNNVITVNPSYVETITSRKFQVAFLNDSGTLPDFTIRSSTNTDTNIKSSLVLDLGSVKLSDSLGLQDSIYVYDGADWVRSTGWRRGNSGIYTNLLALLTKEVLSLHAKPIERYNGDIVGAYSFGVRYFFEGGYWMPLGGSFHANDDLWSGEWFKIESDLSGLDFDDPISIGGGAEFSGRISSQQGIDEIINVTEIRASDSEVTGNSTVGGNFDVTGDTTVEDFTHNGSQIENIKNLTNSSGSSYDILPGDYMIFNTWSGGNGTSDINLPAAADNEGRLLRFKSDGTISSNTSINLNPVSGETIDGETSFSFNRDYDGVMLLAHNENWYIIQRKSK